MKPKYKNKHSLYRRAWGILKDELFKADMNCKASYCKEDIWALMNHCLDKAGNEEVLPNE